MEKTPDGKNIEFPEGYDTLEGRERIVAGLNKELYPDLSHNPMIT